MRIMTFNIQHCRNYLNRTIDIPLFAETIRNYEADFCGLNEVRGEGPIEGYTNQTDALGDLLKFKRYFGRAIMVNGTSPYGNAILGRYAFKSVETLAVPEPEEETEDTYYEERCIIRAVAEVEGREICLLVTHMGLAVDERINAVSELCKIIDETDIPLVLMGDFNTTPDDEVLAPLFERLRDTDETADYLCKPTFPSDAPEIKIDYVLYRGLECVSVETVAEVVSDHLPIVAEFEFAD